MYEQLTSPDLVNRTYTELLQTRERERFARRIARDRKVPRVAARRPSRQTARPVVRPAEG